MGVVWDRKKWEMSFCLLFSRIHRDEGEPDQIKEKMSSFCLFLLRFLLFFVLRLHSFFSADRMSQTDRTEAYRAGVKQGGGVIPGDDVAAAHNE